MNGTLQHAQDFEFSQIPEQVKKQDDIRSKIKDDAKNKKSVASGNIGTLSVLKFAAYIISLGIIMEITTDFNESLGLNTALQEHFLNQKSQDLGTDTKIIQTKRSWNEIKTKNDVHTFFLDNILVGAYDALKGFRTHNNSFQEAYYYNMFTPIRYRQKRANMKAEKIRSSVFDSRFVSGEEFQNTAPYGTDAKTNASPFFRYEPDQKGFVILLETTYLPPNVPEEEFANLIGSGFYDEKTTELKIDYGLYSSINNIITYVSFTFRFSPTSHINYKVYQLRTFRATPYRDGNAGALIFFTIAFLILFVLYFMEQFTRVFEIMKNNLGNIKVRTFCSFIFSICTCCCRKKKKENIKGVGKKGLNEVNKLAKEIENSIKKTIVAILKHIFNIWTLLDLVSVICSMLAVIVWLQYIFEQKITTSLDIIQFQDGIFEDNTNTAKGGAYEHLVSNLETVSSRYELVYRMQALNIMLLILKILRIAPKYIPKIKDLVEILDGVMERLIPFIVLLFTILFAYALSTTFFYGDIFEEFTTIGGSLKYFMMNLHGSFHLVNQMYETDPAFTLGFSIAFIFIINFIFSSMFLIYVIHTYMDYYKEKHNETEKSKTSQFEFQPHPVWEVINQTKNEIPLRVYQALSKVKNRCFNCEQRYKQKRAQMFAKEESDKRLLNTYTKFQFNINIQDQLKNKQRQNPAFNNDVTNKKISDQKKISTVKSIWAILGTWLMIVFFLLLIYEHTNVSVNRSTIASIEEVIDQRFMSVRTDDGTFTNHTFPTPLNYLQNFEQVKEWTESLFAFFAQDGNITLTDGREFKGFFWNKLIYLFTNQYRVSIRRKSIVTSENGKYNSLSTKTFTKSFDPDAKNPTGEYTQNITGVSSQTVYQHSSSGGYGDAGGYILTFPVPQASTQIAQVVDDRALDWTTNSIVIDFPAFQVSQEDFVYVAIIIAIDNASNLKVTIRTELLPSGLYKTHYQRFIAFLEVLIVLAFIDYIIFLYLNIIEKVQFYNYWYKLNIQDFPKLMIEQRNKKEPEWIRKTRYVLEFKQLFNLLLVIFLGMTICTWIYYLIMESEIREKVSGFLQDTNGDKNPDYKGDYNGIIKDMETASTLISVARSAKSLVIIVLAIQLIYYYSHLAQFQVLTNTFSRSFRMVPYMFIFLILCLFAFSAFLQYFLGSEEEQFGSILTALQYSLESLATLGPKLRYYLSQDHMSTFLTFLFYLPFVILVKYIVANMFLGVIFQSYQEVKVDAEENVKHEPIKLYEEFEDNVDKVFKFKEPHKWSVNCTSLILKEIERRKGISRLCKQVAKLNAQEEAYKQLNEHAWLEMEEKKPEVQLRMKYWNYFRTFSSRLSIFMTYCRNLTQEYEDEIINNKENLKEKKADQEIQGFIKHFEEQISKNLQDIVRITKTLDDYHQHKLEEEEKQAQNDYKFTKNNNKNR